MSAVLVPSSYEQAVEGAGKALADATSVYRTYYMEEYSRTEEKVGWKI